MLYENCFSKDCGSKQLLAGIFSLGIEIYITFIRDFESWKKRELFRYAMKDAAVTHPTICVKQNIAQINWSFDARALRTDGRMRIIYSTMQLYNQL